jgi:hypothetical protein
VKYLDINVRPNQLILKIVDHNLSTVLQQFSTPRTAFDRETVNSGDFPYNPDFLFFYFP